MQKSEKIRYFLYARKSSESEDRQVQSIDDQIGKLEEMAGKFGLDIAEIFQESMSAKSPGRPVFNEMMRRIEEGEAGGIICWKLNRLARNMVDGGRIIENLNSGTIGNIRTFANSHLPKDNVLPICVEFGMANQFVKDLSVDTKRGLQSKVEKGWLPCRAPTGYKNDVINKTIVKDPKRFALVRKMWDLMLTGSYSPSQILDIANDEWGFRTRKYKRSGGKPLSLSGLYRIFGSKFYAGIMKYNDQQRPGKHEPMITLDEYDRVQSLLGKKEKARNAVREFAFTGAIRCGECGCLVTAEEKKKKIKSTGETRKYRYYHCTKRKRKCDCSQKSIRKEDLEIQIEKEIEKFTILPEFRDWALEVLSEKNDAEIEDRTKIYESQQKALADTQKQLDNLTRMRCRDLIDDEEYARERDSLKGQIFELKEKVVQTEKRAESWLELTEKTFDFATYARSRFVEGDTQAKKEIFLALGQNFLLKDGKLSIKANSWLVPIAESYPELEREYRRLEPAKDRLDKAKTEAFTSVLTRWGRLLDAFTTVNWAEISEELRIFQDTFQGQDRLHLSAVA